MLFPCSLQDINNLIASQLYEVIPLPVVVYGLLVHIFLLLFRFFSSFVFLVVSGTSCCSCCSTCLHSLLFLPFASVFFFLFDTPRFDSFNTIMASASIKHEASSSTFEVDSHSDQYLERQTKTFKLIDAARVSITALALLCGVTILGLSADAIRVYNTTRLEGSPLLSVWPDSFDMQPTVALVAGSSLVILANTAALLCSKVPRVSCHVLYLIGTPPSDQLADPPSVAPKQHPRPHPRDVCRACGWLRGRTGGCHRLLRDQRLGDDRLPAQLDVPVEVGSHGAGPLLWHTVRTVMGKRVPGCHPRAP